MTLFQWAEKRKPRTYIESLQHTAKFGAKGARKPAQQKLERIMVKRMKREQGKDNHAA